MQLIMKYYLTNWIGTVFEDMRIVSLDHTSVKRKQYTVINGVDSSICDVKCGVPQGSVLGPLLFALYINDIYMAVGKDNIRLFADDTALFMCNPNLNTLISDVA